MTRHINEIRWGYGGHLISSIFGSKCRKTFCGLDPLMCTQPSGPDSFLKAIRGNSDLNAVRPTGDAGVIKRPRLVLSIKRTMRGTFESSGGLSRVVWGKNVIGYCTERTRPKSALPPARNALLFPGASPSSRPPCQDALHGLHC